jgi:sugar phosphate isomerase/epimerase
MKLGMITDSVGNLGFEEMLALAARLRLDALEFGCGNWSAAPHLDRAALLADDASRAQFLKRIEAHGLQISALNCSGNPLHPGEEGRAHDRVTRETIELAGRLGVERVVLMSGCPGAPGDSHPNWITVSWPPAVREVLAWQWEKVVIPYWRDLAAFARGQGVRRLCIELHGHQNVYNVRTLLRLREAVGETVGANFDPSHLMWMGADPIAAIRALGPAIYHVHAKDTRIDRAIAGVDGLIETLPNGKFQSRGWNYVTLGYGHGEAWWAEFVATLAAVGYDDVLSIEHEDMMMSPVEGVEKTVALLDRTAFNRPAPRARPSHE